MEIIKTGVKDLDFSKMTLGEVKQYWTTIEGDSLHQVLPGRYRQPYLCQLKKEIEGVRKEKGKGYDLQGILVSGRFLKGQHYFPLNVDNHEVWEKASEKEKLDEVYYFLDSYFPVFGAEPNLGAIVFRDLVMIRDNYTEKYEFYSTPEVLKVLEQWIEYLEKFEQEKAR